MDVDNTAKYHVVLEGRRVGPYDRRTIVGMRIKETLSSEHVLLGTDGSQMTVGELLAHRDARASAFQPSQTGAYSLVRMTASGSLAGVSGKGMTIPAFVGELEVRVQSEVLRLAGRYRRPFGTSETRIKIPLGLIQLAQVQGSRVDLWLRSATDVVVTDEMPLQRVSINMFSPEVAKELLAALPRVPAPDAAQAQIGSIPASSAAITWGAVVAAIAVIGVVALVLLTRRVV